MRYLGLELRHNLHQNSDAKASEQPANIKHADSFCSSLQDTTYKEKSRTKNESSSPAKRVAVSSSESTEEGTFEHQYERKDADGIELDLPPVKRATTVPLFVEPSDSRNLWTKESEATTEAMTPRSYPYRNEPNEANRATKN
jgi:hypothetical protein